MGIESKNDLDNKNKTIRCLKVTKEEQEAKVERGGAQQTSQTQQSPTVISETKIRQISV